MHKNGKSFSFEVSKLCPTTRVSAFISAAPFYESKMESCNFRQISHTTLTIIVTKVTLKHSFTFPDDSNSGGKSKKRIINATTTK